jgi:hypothetical protein
MTTEQMIQKVAERQKELITLPEVKVKLMSFTDVKKAQEWLFNQALITLLYSHEERMAMAASK